MIPNPNLTTADVLDALRASGKPLQEWGKAVDGTPLRTARAGGDRQPAIFITAGAHATETAGVHGALNLLNLLETEHELHVLPLRDPFGFAGVNHCLGFAAGERVELANASETLEYLRSRGQLLWEQPDMCVFRLGDFGFVWNAPRPALDTFWTAHAAVRALIYTDPDRLRPRWGRRVMLLHVTSDVEGSGEMQRCFHMAMSQAGEYLHLNRFFGRADAPAEVRAVEQLMEAARPGLTCDLHEGNGQGFWMPIPRPALNSERVLEMTRAYFEYIIGRGYPITTYEEWLATDRSGSGVEWMQPEPSLPGMFWCTTMSRGEGPNLMDHAAQYGIGFGTEAPLAQPLAMRVDGITQGIAAAIRVWERFIDGDA